jgi:protein TonB
MNYAQQQRNPGKHTVGIVVVIIFHLILGYALVTGLARKVVDVIKQPLETKIIEEQKAPPPDTPPPPPPKFAPPPPPFIPPPEVSVQAPTNTANTISAVTNTKPVAAPPAPPAPPAPKAAVTNAIGVACPNASRIQADLQYPREAQRDGITGSFTVEFTVGPNGEIKEPAVLGSANRYLSRAALAAVQQFKCIAQGQDVRVQVPFTFKLE